MSRSFDDLLAHVVIALEEEFGGAIVDDYLHHYDAYDNLVSRQAVVEVNMRDDSSTFKVLVVDPEVKRSKGE